MRRHRAQQGHLSQTLHSGWLSATEEQSYGPQPWQVRSVPEASQIPQTLFVDN